MLNIRKLHKQFGSHEVLRGIDLTVNQGDVVVILGPSGSGKTTLLRSINFLEPADSGTIELDGKAIEIAKATKQDVRSIRKHTGFVFQNYNLFANKTAEQNITEGLIYGLVSLRMKPVALPKKFWARLACVSLPITILANSQVVSSNVLVLPALLQPSQKYSSLMSRPARSIQSLLVMYWLS